MEKVIVIKTENFDFARDIHCDLCDATLVESDYKEPEIYATFWQEPDNIYLEKYICKDCYEKCYYDINPINFEDADVHFKAALERDFERTWHSILVPVSSFDDFEEILENPWIIDIIGEKV